MVKRTKQTTKQRVLFKIKVSVHVGHNYKVLPHTGPLPWKRDLQISWARYVSQLMTHVPLTSNFQGHVRWTCSFFSAQCLTVSCLWQSLTFRRLILAIIYIASVAVFCFQTSYFIHYIYSLCGSLLLSSILF